MFLKKGKTYPLKRLQIFTKETNLTIAGRREEYIAFYLYITTYYDVGYYYYFTSSKNEYKKYDYGIIKENVINEKWSSIFSNIPYD